MRALKLDDVRKRILEFQEKYSILDPNAQAAANAGLTAELAGDARASWRRIERPPVLSQ